LASFFLILCGVLAKGEITVRMNERDLIHIVEVVLSEGGFGTASQ
jgi:hypothetical protein